MSEEKQLNTGNQEKECQCICQNKYVKKFAVVALGSFVGVYAALSLFTAVHKPCPCMMHGMHGGFGMPPHHFMHKDFGNKKFKHQRPPFDMEKFKGQKDFPQDGVPQEQK